MTHTSARLSWQPRLKAMRSPSGDQAVPYSPSQPPEVSGTTVELLADFISGVLDQLVSRHIAELVRAEKDGAS